MLNSREILEIIAMTTATLVVAVLGIVIVFNRSNQVASSNKRLTNDQIITEAKKCLDAGLNWDTTIGRTEVFCTQK